MVDEFKLQNLAVIKLRIVCIPAIWRSTQGSCTLCKFEEKRRKLIYIFKFTEMSSNGCMDKRKLTEIWYTESY